MKNNALLIITLLLSVSLTAQKSNTSDTCLIHLVFVDSETHLPIFGQIQIYSINKHIQSVFDGTLSLPCFTYDSLYINPVGIGYQDTVLIHKRQLDTILLIRNSYTFDEIEIVANKKRDKIYRLGKKNKKCAIFYSFQAMSRVNEEIDPVFNFKLVSLVTNNKKKRLKIDELSLYIKDIPIEMEPNLQLSIYKNNKGELGRRTNDKLTFEKMKKNEGWAKLILSESISLPSNGFFIVLEKIDSTSYSPSVGCISLNSDENVKTYSCVNIKNENEGYFYSKKVLKLFIKARD
jgi:hypothetical protein